MNSSLRPSATVKLPSARLGLTAERADACRRALASKAGLAAAAGADFSAWVSACLLLNTNTYVDQLLKDHRLQPSETSSASAQGRKSTGALRLSNLRQMPADLSQRRQLHLRHSAGDISGRAFAADS